MFPWRRWPYNSLVLWLVAALAVKVFSTQPHWVLLYYSKGLYPHLAEALRLILGWVPFSIGDVLYLGAIVFLVILIVRVYKKLRNKLKIKELVVPGLLGLVRFGLVVWVAFSVLWGLNYDRPGLAKEMSMQAAADSASVRALAQALALKLNLAAQALPRTHHGQPRLDTLVAAAQAAFNKDSAFIAPYAYPSVKYSLFSPLSRYVGYTGYLNPFTGEAHLNREVPSFMKPFIICHEMAHQVGYARESDASMVAFLVGRQADQVQFRYSAYFNLYRTAAGAMARVDSAAVAQLQASLHPVVQDDFRKLDAYLQRFDNPVEKLMTSVYEKYLHLNNQPEGMASYSRVLNLVIGWTQKHGMENL